MASSIKVRFYNMCYIPVKILYIATFYQIEEKRQIKKIIQKVVHDRIFIRH